MKRLRKAVKLKWMIAVLLTCVLALPQAAFAYGLPFRLEEAEQPEKAQPIGTVLCDTVLYAGPEPDAAAIGSAELGQEFQIYAANINDSWDVVMTEEGDMAYIRSDEISFTAPTFARDDRPDTHETDGGKNGYPGELYNDDTYLRLMTEAKKYIGMPYVWGGSTPETSFDCSGYVCWVFNQTGVHNLGRTNAQGIYDACKPVPREEAVPGDLAFFTGTYEAAWPVTHVAIYVGNGYMLHCGKPIGYSPVDTPYWTEHFYAFGRLEDESEESKKAVS